MGFLLHLKDVGAKAAFELTNQHFAVFGQAQVDDAVAVQRQCCAHELGLAQFAKRVFDDAKFAAQGNLFGTGGAAYRGERARGGKPHKVWHLIHGLPVRVEEVVVVVRHDGVLHAVFLDQDGALGALDVQAVYAHVIARLVHLNALQLGGGDFALRIAGKREGG